MIKKTHRVLFVDDDPLVLRGLRRSADDLSNWNVDFAASGQEALNKLTQNEFDAIVSDMLMPGMDGLQLLEAARQARPEVLRFILSGVTSDEQTMKATNLVHQVIPKPCEIERIYTIVERSCRLREMLSDPNLLRIITGIKTLPSVPMLYNRLVKELQSENTNAQAVGNIISQDVAMTAKILQLVNSAFFSLTDNVSNPQRAVAILGLNTIKALVLGLQVFSEFQGRMGLPISVDALWKHSLQVSSMAYTMARDLDLNAQEKEDMRVAGVLHDIGILLYFKIPMVAINLRFNKGGLISTPSEYQTLGISHAEMGGYLLGIWGLPTPIVEGITFHHKPWLQVSKNTGVMNLLYVANGLLNMCQYEKEVNYPAYLEMDYVNKLGFTDYLNEWTVTAKTILAKS